MKSYSTAFVVCALIVAGIDLATPVRIGFIGDAQAIIGRPMTPFAMPASHVVRRIAEPW